MATTFMGFGAPAAAGGNVTTTTTNAFGAAPTIATGFGAAPAATTGFGVASTARPGFGTGFGGVGTGAPSLSTSVPSAATPAVPPIAYPGIKGPGNCTTWMRAVDFTQVTDSTPFESLPAPLQQHLVELRTFMHAERQANEAVRCFLEETGNAVPPTSSYRALQHRITQLLSGPRAVDSVMVSCMQQEREAQQFAHVLDQFERDIALYEQSVWNQLVESTGAQGEKMRPVVLGSSVTPTGALSRCYGEEGAAESGIRSSSRSHNNSSSIIAALDENEDDGLFTKLMDRLEQRMAVATQQIYELERTLMPTSVALIHAAMTQGGVTPVNNSSSSSSNIRPYSNGTDDRLGGYRVLPSCGLVPSITNQEDRTPLLLLSSAPMTSGALSCTEMTNQARAGRMLARAEQVAGLQTIAQITASLQNATQALVGLSGWTSGLHARSNVARELFARQYGRAEAEALFAPPPSSQLRQLQLLLNRPVDHATRTALYTSQFTSQKLGSMDDITSPTTSATVTAAPSNAAVPTTATTLTTATATTTAPTGTAATSTTTPATGLTAAPAPTTQAMAAPAAVSFASGDTRPTRRAR